MLPALDTKYLLIGANSFDHHANIMNPEWLCFVSLPMPG